jgi:hypothetical protein
MNMQLLKAADFNEKLRERGVPRAVTVQKICRYAEDENEVRGVLAAIWKTPVKSKQILTHMVETNQDVYNFEKMLEATR